jgi:hypothetical protein
MSIAYYLLAAALGLFGYSQYFRALQRYMHPKSLARAGWVKMVVGGMALHGAFSMIMLKLHDDENPLALIIFTAAGVVTFMAAVVLLVHMQARSYWEPALTKDNLPTIATLWSAIAVLTITAIFLTH